MVSVASAAVEGVLSHIAQVNDSLPSSGDPYLEHLPAFTYAMPVQIVVLGMTVTLLALLLIHLLFTVRYHLPLSRLNYAYQVGAVVLSLGRTCAELHMVMTTLMARPRAGWPYMFDYIEITVPSKDWSVAANTVWLCLQAVTSLAVHLTHIQFLTLLFPSALEMRLIMGLLGPLALVSSFLYFTELSSRAAVDDLGDAIRNTANSTLTLLYTLAIFIWGFTLNRSRAWRTEGGTATFGVFALVLGVSGTAINFVEVKEDRMRWLPGVVSCILLWQSWVGFWWWVGAGMWTGEAEEVGRKEEKRRRREENRKLKREKREKKAAALVAAASAAVGHASSEGGGESTVRRRRITVGGSQTGSGEGEAIEMRPMGPTPLPGGTTSGESVSSGSTPPPAPSRLDPLFALFRPFLARLRVAHDEAAVKKAAEPRGVEEGTWGLRQLGLRGRAERGEREGERGEELQAGDRRAGFEADGAGRLEDWEDEDDTTTEGTDDRGSGAARSRSEDPPAIPPARVGEPPTRWTQRGLVARWRVRDRTEF